MNDVVLLSRCNIDTLGAAAFACQGHGLQSCDERSCPISSAQIGSEVTVFLRPNGLRCVVPDANGRPVGIDDLER